ncbi:hypothetical protein ACFVTT_38575 [Streptomyces niveus]|uniref:hypothetical protein n=1 Tax=Streptomyces niveus TaxID=193462 RepID=UPI0034157ACC
MRDRIREATIRGARWLATTAPSTPITTVDLDFLAETTAWSLTPRTRGNHGSAARATYETARAKIRATLPDPLPGEPRTMYAQRLSTSRTAVSA